MPHLSAISKETHIDKSWTRFTSYNFAARSNLVLLVGAEAAKACHAFPMAFVKEQNRFSLVAVLSPAPGTNMFVASDGRWLGGYVPSAFRGYPFRLAKAEGKEQLVLCVDEDSGLIRDDKTAEPFFDDQGRLSKPMQDILDFLARIEENRVLTGRAVAALADAGVIAQWLLKIKDGDREQPVKGLYKIDEAKLNSLADDLFLKLRKAGSLPIAYAQLLSMDNMQVFEKLAKTQEQMKNNVPDVGSFLGDDDVISFQ
jgi:hypothetical protein